MAKIKNIKQKKSAGKTKSKSVNKPLVKTAKTSIKKKPAQAKVKTKAKVKAIVKTKAVISKPKKTTSSSPVLKKTVKSKKASTKTSSYRERKIQDIKSKLLMHKDSLLDEAEEALNELPGQTTFPDQGDQATAETDINFMLRLRGREQRLLTKIDEAIDRLETKTFGICEDCGEEIEIKRLEARPVTTMCINCKTIQEEEEKLRE